MTPSPCNVNNKTIFCKDNLFILEGINSHSVDLIYLETPPFNKKKQFTAPIRSAAEGTSFSDIFRQEDVKDDWVLAIKEEHPEIHSLLETTKKIVKTAMTRMQADLSSR